MNAGMAESNHPEPVAVLGMGCRFPGAADTADAFWDLLAEGRQATGPAPKERWQWYEARGPQHQAALARVIGSGSFLRDVAGFDTEFFGITPREAELMDPMQRILLETTWEALEHAGVPPSSLAGTDTGVFVGTCTEDYGRRSLENLPAVEAWTGIGAARCAPANRISHILDLRGPSLVTDTACSASLVALHLACQSLRLHESTLAIVGGVNLVISPGETLSLDAAGALSADGRSKPFDADADGYGRGEGCGVLVLKLLWDANRDDDRVLALVRGSAVNQDGHTNGIMAPCGEAQEYVMLRACRNAGVVPGSIDYVEAHGTGTRVGDPMEAAALSAVYGAGRDPGYPCLIGSVKSNIGHLEGAAGVASVIKTVLALGQRRIPPSLVTRLNPEIPWESNGLRVTTGTTQWPRRSHPPRAAVSGFGYGGTVAHIVLESAPERTAVVVPGPGQEAGLFPLSAGSETALREYAGRLAHHLTAGEFPLASVGYTLARRRSHLPHRAVIAASDSGDLAARLQGFVAGDTIEGVVSGVAVDKMPSRPVWIFSGHGSQWRGMGRELLRSEPAFISAIDEVAPIFIEEIGFSPRTVLTDGAIDGVDRAQTMIFAMQIGLAAVWRSFGVTPAAVIGHSVGEIAAAVACGALSPQDGARLICRRSALLREAAGKGSMALVGISFAEAAERLAGRTDLTAAIASSPSSTVISGAPDAVASFAAEAKRSGLMVRKVDSDVAFHSAHMDPLLARLVDATAGLSTCAPRLPMYLTAVEDPRTRRHLDGSYWAANLRNPVQLASAVAAAAEDGHRTFLEISPHPVVTHSVIECLADSAPGETFVGGTLRRNRAERETLLSALAEAHCHGVEVDWSRLNPLGDVVTLPPPAWQRRKLWLEPEPETYGPMRLHDVRSHALLGTQTRIAGSSLRTWHSELDDSNRPYPGSHAINGIEIVPAAVLILTFMATQPAGEPPVLTDVSMRLPLMTAELRELQVVRDGSALQLASRLARDEGEWSIHASATAGPLTAPSFSAPRLAERGGWESLDPSFVGRRLASVGVPSTGFDWTIEELSRAGRALRARVRVAGRPTTWAPALDAVMSVAPCAFPGDAQLRMVVHAGSVTVTGDPPEEFLLDVVVDDDREDTVNVQMADPNGVVIASLTGLRYPVIGSAASLASGRTVLRAEWQRVTVQPSGRSAPHEVLVVGPDSTTLGRVRDTLSKAGIRYRVFSGPSDLPDPLTTADVLVVPPAGPDLSITEAAVKSGWLLAETGRRVASDEAANIVRLWCLTTGVRESEGEQALAQAAIWGIARAIAIDLSKLEVRIIDSAPEGHGRFDLIPELLAVPPAEDVIAVRDGSAWVLRLAEVGKQSASEGPSCQPDGTYLVTGGLSGPGLAAARSLAERGARRIVLADPRPFPSRQSWPDETGEETRQRIDSIRAMERLGTTIKVLTTDLTDSDRATVHLSEGELGLPAIRGVIHTMEPAGRPPITAEDGESFAAAVANAIRGALTLHRVFPPGKVDFFVAHTSCGALLRIPGQSVHDAVGTFVEALAAHRASDTIALSWLPGDEPAWDIAARHSTGHFVFANPFDPRLGGEPLLPIFAGIRSDRSDEATSNASADGEYEFSHLEPEEIRKLVFEEVGTLVATEMKLPVTDLDPHRPLVDLGFDSVMTVVTRRRLQKRFGHELPATLLWQRPTVMSIADHITDMIARELSHSASE